jgi:hypothetical protein
MRPPDTDELLVCVLSDELQLAWKHAPTREGGLI